MLFCYNRVAYKTFGDKINLSNSTKADSQDAQIDTFGDNDSNVIVTWWERNATSNEPVARISTDSGKTFGQIMELSTNETVGGNSTSGWGNIFLKVPFSKGIFCDLFYAIVCRKNIMIII
jgi:hypothetical protein